MKAVINLFDIGMDFYAQTYIFEGLQQCAKSISFPLLPINIQQQIQKRLKDSRAQRNSLGEDWPSSSESLKAFIKYLRANFPPPLKTSESMEEAGSFLTEALSLVNQLEIASSRRVREAMAGGDINPDNFKDPELRPKIRKGKE